MAVDVRGEWSSSASVTLMVRLPSDSTIILWIEGAAVAAVKFGTEGFDNIASARNLYRFNIVRRVPQKFYASGIGLGYYIPFSPAFFTRHLICVTCKLLLPFHNAG